MKIKTGTRARVRVRLTSRGGGSVRPGDIVTIAQHKVREGTCTIYRPKVGISGVDISNDLEILPS